MKHTSIEWTDHTFNPWWGCTKVSPGCQYCYAESLAGRFRLADWGATAPRQTFDEKHWNQPITWQQQARRKGQRARVFCASMTDVFEDNQGIERDRQWLWDTIERTPDLDWLLLTKRPAHIAGMVPHDWIEAPRANVWYGVSVENQHYADTRIPQLLAVPAAVRFLSCEPLLGPVDLSVYLTTCDWCGGSTFGHHDCYEPTGLDWLIVGGESGSRARPMDLAWVRQLRRQCEIGGVAFFMKQLGGRRGKGGKLEDFPEDLQVREFPIPVRV